MNPKEFMNKLKLIETEMQVRVWELERNEDAPKSVVEEMNEALTHISSAIDILDRDDL
tara:strand:+ start:57 stop:230 length:174 start_codon:yes stop_codon:yes gene_type:complete